ncbi:MAG: 50S ribosomal protein L21 [Acutalibacteraceae bacterium]
MYAIFETGGKQYRAENGTVLFVEKLNAAENETVTFDKVLLVNDGKNTKVGTPYLSDVTITAKVLKQGKDKKITVFTYKPKKNEKRKLGHRQPYTKIEITAVGAEEKKPTAKKPAAKKTAEAKDTAPAAKKPAAKKPAAKKPAAEKPAAEKAENAAE